MLASYPHSFLSIPIDVFFGCCYGPLPYRSIQFEHRLQRESHAAPVVNFTDEGPFTRRTSWGMLPNSYQPRGRDQLVTYERPCSMDDNPGEYYYPVINPESNALLGKYQVLALDYPQVTFCGRTGLFRYLDMLPAVTMHLQIASNFLSVMQSQK